MFFVIFFGRIVVVVYFSRVFDFKKSIFLWDGCLVFSYRVVVNRKGILSRLVGVRILIGWD